MSIDRSWTGYWEETLSNSQRTNRRHLLIGALRQEIWWMETHYRTEEIHTPVGIRKIRLGLQSLQSCIWDVKYTHTSAHKNRDSDNKNPQAFLIKRESLESDALNRLIYWVCKRVCNRDRGCVDLCVFWHFSNVPIRVCITTFIVRSVIGQQLSQNSLCSKLSAGIQSDTQWQWFMDPK